MQGCSEVVTLGQWAVLCLVAYPSAHLAAVVDHVLVVGGRAWDDLGEYIFVAKDVVFMCP
jgi:hypothetical protein